MSYLVRECSMSLLMIHYPVDQADGSVQSLNAVESSIMGDRANALAGKARRYEVGLNRHLSASNPSCTTSGPQCRSRSCHTSHRSRA